jgi:NADH-quinone oxidoreductase E subunit
VAQPESFAFSPEMLETAKATIAKYPAGRQRSAVMPLLDLAQRQDGWLSKAAMDHVAEMLDLAPIRVYEVATFYTMYRLRPVGKAHVQVCTNISCWLRGAEDVVRAAEDVFGLKMGQGNAEATLEEAECLGACCNAPMMQIGDDYFEDLTYDTAKAVFEALKAGRAVTPGSQTGRQGSCPEGGPTTLKETA